ncbi:hypothetical protein E2C01_036917 [Portunus trituberculatus]|uniref:Uncharacterized protein n=1 Tax=Portunus trituberculatus TaxID=210409 RepID=A0A5B7FFN1_PORTR|nr:hypothetical protein [Portunus trituberculatus]
MSFTKLRLSGHNLAIVTGLCNRRGRGRVPVEERLVSDLMSDSDSRTTLLFICNVIPWTTCALPTQKLPM